MLAAWFEYRRSPQWGQGSSADESDFAAGWRAHEQHSLDRWLQDQYGDAYNDGYEAGWNNGRDALTQ
jgi:hypothetical protein